MNRRELLKLAAASCLPALPAIAKVVAQPASPKPYRYYLDRVDPRFEDTIHWAPLGMTDPAALHAFKLRLAEWPTPDEFPTALEHIKTPLIASPPGVDLDDFKEKVRAMIRNRHRDPAVWNVLLSKPDLVPARDPTPPRTICIFSANCGLEWALDHVGLLGCKRDEILVSECAKEPVYYTKTARFDRSLMCASCHASRPMRREGQELAADAWSDRGFVGHCEACGYCGLHPCVDHFATIEDCYRVYDPREISLVQPEFADDSIYLWTMSDRVRHNIRSCGVYHLERTPFNVIRAAHMTGRLHFTRDRLHYVT